MVRSGGKRLRPAFCHWGFVGAGGDPADERVVRAGAAIELMHAFALFHDDVMDDSASRRGAPTTHVVYGGTPRRGRLGRRVAALRRGRGDPRRRPRLRARRPAADRRPAGGVAAVERAAHRAQRRPVPRHPRLGAGRAEPREGRADRPLQERQVHGRAAAAPRCGARRPGRRPGAAARPERLRPPARRRLPDARRRDRARSATRSVTGKPVGDDLREGKPTPLLARAVALAEPAELDVLARVGRAAPRRRRGRQDPAGDRRHRRPRRARGAHRGAGRRGRRRPRRACRSTAEAPRASCGALAAFVVARVD